MRLLAGLQARRLLGTGEAVSELFPRSNSLEEYTDYFNLHVLQHRILVSGSIILKEWLEEETER